MLLNKDEKVAVLKLRIKEVRVKTLFGFYKSYQIGEKKIRKLKAKIRKLGGNPEEKIFI